MEDSEALCKLIEAASCPVCFERLPTDISCCVNGHAICSKCSKDLIKCPTCRDDFTRNKNISFSQVLAALPNRCKIEHCKDIHFNIEEHEKYCAFRNIKCEVCSWKGFFSHLLDHVKENHVLMSTDSERCIREFKQKGSVSTTGACIIHNQFFWRTTSVDTQTKVFSTKFLCVPSKKVTESVYLTIIFENEDMTNLIKRKLSFDCNTEKNCLSFNFDMLEDFIDKTYGHLRYQMLIELA